jgi:hypothetical protein
MLLHLGVCIGPDNVGHGENADETLSFSTGDDRQQTDFMSPHLLHHPIKCVIRRHGNQMPGGGNAIILPLPPYSKKSGKYPKNLGFIDTRTPTQIFPDLRLVVCLKTASTNQRLHIEPLTEF